MHQEDEVPSINGQGIRILKEFGETVDESEACEDVASDFGNALLEIGTTYDPLSAHTVKKTQTSAAKQKKHIISHLVSKGVDPQVVGELDGLMEHMIEAISLSSFNPITFAFIVQAINTIASGPVSMFIASSELKRINAPCDCPECVAKRAARER